MVSQRRNLRDLARRTCTTCSKCREAKITREARLFEDLDLDSIDAVDLVVKLQEYTGRRIAPAEFKSVRTVGDVVDKIHAQISASV